jgi:predicted DNA-binding ArsR family transcriptional regulator
MRDTARDELFDNFDEALEDNDEFTELRRTVQRLVEHLSLPEERTPFQVIQDLLESGQMTLATLEKIVTAQCNSYRSSMRKMNKADLLETGQRMGYHLNSDMTIAQIHEVVGL